MKHKVRLFGLLLCAIGLPSLSANLAYALGLGANGLPNGGFETGVLQPWYTGRIASGGEAWNVTSADSHTGAFSATNTGNMELRQDFTPIPIRSISRISFWIKHVGLGSDTNVVLWFNNGGNTNANTPTIQSGVWQFVDVTNLANRLQAPGSQVTGISIYGNSAGNPNFTRTYVDDVSITIPEPSGASLTAMAILCVLRRRARSRGAAS